LLYHVVRRRGLGGASGGEKDGCHSHNNEETVIRHCW
jgi:hypothetical protein